MADYATLLRDHVTLTCRSVDRIFLQAYVPKLQSVGGVCQFLYWQKGFGIPSSAAFGKIGDAYVAEVYRWAKKNAIPVRRFAKGENKEEIARPLIEAAEREGGDGKVVLIGIAQEKTLLLALAAAAALPPDTRGCPGRLRLRVGVSPVRSLRHPGVRPTGGRAVVFRATHPRSPRHWAAGIGVVDLRPTHQLTHAGHLAHPGHHQGRRSADQLLLPLQPDQTVLPAEHRALRTETVVCNTRDFGIGRRVTAENWKALRAVGEAANQRLCDAQAADARPAPDVATFTQVTRPSQIDGQHTPALPFGDPRVMAVLAAVTGFTHLLAGFDNPTLVRTITTLLGCHYTSRQATYDLHRLKRKGLIVRLPGHHRYQLTPLGRRVAVLFTKVYGRVLAPGLAELDPRLPTDLANRSDLAHAWRQLDRRLNQFTNTALTAA